MEKIFRNTMLQDRSITCCLIQSCMIRRAYKCFFAEKTRAKQHMSTCSEQWTSLEMNCCEILPPTEGDEPSHVTSWHTFNLYTCIGCSSASNVHARHHLNPAPFDCSIILPKWSLGLIWVKLGGAHVWNFTILFRVPHHTHHVYILTLIVYPNTPP